MRDIAASLTQNMMRDIAASLSTPNLMRDIAASLSTPDLVRDIAASFSAQNLMRDIAASLSTPDLMRDLDAETIQALDDLANEDWLVDAESETGADRQALALSAVLVCAALIIHHLLPSLLLLASMVTDAVRTGALAFDVLDEATKDIPGLDGLLKFMDMGGFILLARKAAQPGVPPGSPDGEGDDGDS